MQVDPQLEPKKPQPLPVILDSKDLFQGRPEIVIEHEGVRYHLRITKKGKLLLHK